MRTTAAEEAATNCWKLQLTQCVSRGARSPSYAETCCCSWPAECWDKVPVEPTGFMDAVTKVYSDHTTKIPCSTTYPLTVYAEEGGSN